MPIFKSLSNIDAYLKLPKSLRILQEILISDNSFIGVNNEFL